MWHERVKYMAIFYSEGRSDALMYAVRLLHDAGIEFLPCPDRQVTHLLLPVPSFDSEGRIRGGGSLEALLWLLPEDVTVIGGMLDRPELAGYKTLDLLQDPGYVAENAAITAYCALKLAMEQLPVTLKGCQALVIGWGRIGKCLARLLRQLDAAVTVAARKESDRAMAAALGYTAVDTEGLDPQPYRLILNTVPAPVLEHCPGNSVRIDLASSRGIDAEDVLWARGLPGKDAPESSGQLIARRILYNIGKEAEK